MENIEKITKLAEKTGVSMEEAKAALEAAGYDLLDAAIALERKGRTDSTAGTYHAGDAAYTAAEQYHASQAAAGQAQICQDTAKDADQDITSGASAKASSGTADGNETMDADFREITAERTEDSKERRSGNRSKSIDRFLEALKNLLNTLAKAMFQVERKGEEILSVPVLVLVLAIIFAFWVIVPILVIGLFLDCRYHVAGMKAVNVDVNDMMDKASKGASNLKKDFTARKSEK